MAFQFFVEDGQGQNVGSVTLTGLPVDADTIIIDDGVKSAVTFEFETAGGTTGVEVTVGADESATASNLATAITSQRTAGNLDVSAVATAGVVQIHNLNVTGGSITIGALTNGTVVSFTAPTSYCTVDEADTFLTPNIHATTWFALSTTDKEKLLAFATKFLDDRVRWEGTKTVAASGLRWPRTGVVDRDSRAIGANEIPTQLKRATAEMARYLVDADRTTERSQDGLKELKADVIELVFNETYRLPVVPSHMHFLVEGLGILRGNGRGTARVLRT